MEEWTAHDPSDAGFQRAGSGESYKSHDDDKPPITS